MIKMKKENENTDRIEKKLKIENIKRCPNCRLFSSCTEMKEEIVVCSRFKEIPIKEQLIVVNLAEYSKLKGTKNLSLCSFC
jgi:hypothetical protein